MKKLKSYLERWFNGKKVKGIDVSLVDIRVICDLYNSMIAGEKPSFISGKAKEVLDSCGIKIEPCGVGWKVV